MHDSAAAIVKPRSRSRSPTTSSIGRPSVLKTSAPSAADQLAVRVAQRAAPRPPRSADRSDRCSSIWPGVARIVVSIGGVSGRHAE